MGNKFAESCNYLRASLGAKGVPFHGLKMKETLEKGARNHIFVTLSSWVDLYLK